MRISSVLVFFAVLFSFMASAKARVFDLGREQFASYLLFTYGPAKIGDNAFYGESSAASFDSGHDINMGGEVGFVYATGIVSWRFGFEILKPTTLPAVKAQSAGGADLYEIRSDITGYLPKLGMEINLKTTNWYRLSAFGYAGVASLTVQNDYSNLTIAPNADFTAKYKGNGNAMGGGLAFEMAAFDTTTMILEAGYRHLTVDNLVYSEETTGFGGTHAPGDDVQWTDGRRREIDLSGAYASLGFRFWLF